MTHKVNVYYIFTYTVAGHTRHEFLNIIEPPIKVTYQWMHDYSCEEGLYWRFIGVEV